MSIMMLSNIITIEFEKESRDCNKNMETSNQLELVTDKKQLPMHHPVLATGITQSQMHVQIKYSLAHL